MKMKIREVGTEIQTNSRCTWLIITDTWNWKSEMQHLRKVTVICIRLSKQVLLKLRQSKVCFTYMSFWITCTTIHVSKCKKQKKLNSCIEAFVVATFCHSWLVHVCMSVSWLCVTMREVATYKTVLLFPLDEKPRCCPFPKLKYLFGLRWENWCREREKERKRKRK